MSASKVVLNILHTCITILVFILVVYGLMRAGNVAYDMGYRVFTEPAVDSEPGQDVIVEVTQGMSAHSLGVVLEEKGLVEDGNLFAIQMQLSAYAKEIQPGLYTLNTSQTARDMLKVMAESNKPEEEEKAEQ